MKGSNEPISDSDLQALVDGRLPPERCAEVEAYLAAHPEEAKRVRAYGEQKAVLHALFDPVLSEEIPPPLYRILQRSRVRRFARGAAAAGVYLLVGGLLGWWLHGLQRPPDSLSTLLVERAASAHVVYTPEVRHPVEVRADEEAHLVRWLTKRLDAPVKAPNLNALGYRLVGGRLLPAEGSSPAAHFMYEDAQGKRLTLYVRRNPTAERDTAFRFAELGKVRLFYWIDGPLGYALVAELEREGLLKLANAVYQQLER